MRALHRRVQSTGSVTPRVSVDLLSITMWSVPLGDEVLDELVRGGGQPCGVRTRRTLLCRCDHAPRIHPSALMLSCSACQVRLQS